MSKMTNRILLLEAIAEFQAVGSVVSLGAHLLTLLTHKTRPAEAMTIGFSANGAVGTLALVLAVVAPSIV